MLVTSLLLTALMFGATVFYSFGFAAFVLSALPPNVAGPVIRRAFPHFYLFVLGTSALAAMVSFPKDPISGVTLALIAATTLLTRQVLMPAVNAATDRGAKSRFKALHGLSVMITLAHIAAAGFVIIRLAAVT